MRFSSSSRARAFLKSAMNDTRPRIVGTLPLLLRLNSLLGPPPVPDILEVIAEREGVEEGAADVGGRFPPGK